MSSIIGPDPGFGLATLDRVGGQSLDDLRRQQGPEASEGLQTPLAAPAPATPAIDAGETVLQADAWGGRAVDDRLLAGDLRLEARLGTLGLGAAADAAADAVLEAFS